MKRIPMTALLLLAFCADALAQAAAPPQCNDDARELIKDLQRIVTPNGIQESYKSKIGGIDQWVYVRGKDKSNPIILFVHGGPASPLSPVMWTFQRPVEEYFTVVHWDQRGAGKTYLEVDPDSISNTVHIDQYVDDAVEIAQQIKERYGAQKIILMGHSWGTIVGFKAVLERPNLFYAYVGIGQVINARENERLSFEYGLEQAKRHNNSEAVKERESIAPYPGDKPITRERIIIAREWPQYYGGLTAYRHNSNYYFQAPILSPAYSQTDVAAIDKGSLFTLGKVLPEMLEVDFSSVHEFPIPVIMFMGRHDYTTPSQPTAEWLNKDQAPYKRGVWFENSAHMIPFEEPGKMLVSLLEYVRPLAQRQLRNAAASVTSAAETASPASR